MREGRRVMPHCRDEGRGLTLDRGDGSALPDLIYEKE
jgi:hypothetical protein